MSQPLSPAAAAVLAAYHKEAIDYIESWGSFSHKRGMAAALRALMQHEGESVYTDDEGKFSVVREDRILAITAELDGTSPINQEDTMPEFEKLPNGFYWISSKSHPSERSLVRLYTNPDTAQRGIGFGIWDGCAFVPLSDLTQDTVLVLWSENNTSEGNQ